MLKIYNTLTRSKEIFTPITPGKVGLYVCGMTVYDYCHIGHARVMVVFDTVVRYLRHLGYDVTYVRNITDIDDKIIQRAKENGELFFDLTDRFIKAMYEDEKALNVLPPDKEPRVTDSINSIIALIDRLMDNGLAYKGDNGDIFYEVNKFPDYGKLSGKKLDELQAGDRVEININKRNPLDFVLWKRATIGWAAYKHSGNWQLGRPGWHIECSAMSMACLGDHFDIHGGGMDLQFPHHENEIAQSEGVTGHKHVNYWMHNGFVRVDEEKMSKSLGNFFTIREVFKHYHPEVVRFFILSSHYRSPLNYSDKALDDANRALSGLYRALRGVAIDERWGTNSYHECKFTMAMDDDFNTPEALAVLFDISNIINLCKVDDSAAIVIYAHTLRKLGGFLGILQNDPEEFLTRSVDRDQVNQLVTERDTARNDKDWTKADSIRDQLLEMGVIVNDSPDGTTWQLRV